ncbi:MAG: hypothetical protein JSU82_02280 [Rhodospirillales bacterium]|nr:MAG: hypothetical protein JSU82_02280 [Rhodospirillales bacterium]
MRTILTTFVAAAAAMGFATAALAGGGCGGMYTTSLDVATEEQAPMSTPADGTTVATDTITKPIATGQSGG